MDGLIYVDGQYFAPDDASVSLLDSGFTLGLMVFDTIPLYQSRVFRLDAHLERFFASLKAVRFDAFGHSMSELQAIVLETVRRSGLRDATIQVMATRGPRRAGAAIWDWTPTLIIQVLPQQMVINSAQRTGGVRACITTVRSIPPQSIPPQVKHSNRLINYFALLEARDRGVEEPILLDADGYVTEGPNFNIFAVRQERLQTPREGILRGITRDTVIRIAEQHGYAVTEQPLTAYDLYTADEVFITSTSRGAMGVVDIDGRTVGTGSPGPVTRRLDDTYWSWRVESEYAVQVVEDEPELALAAERTE